MIYRQGDILPGPGDYSPPEPSPRDVRDEREIERRTDELAAEAFEQRDDSATKFIVEAAHGEVALQEFMSFVSRALTYCSGPTDDRKYELDKAYEHLRDTFVKDNRELYAEHARDELLVCDTRSDDAYDDSRMER